MQEESKDGQWKYEDLLIEDRQWYIEISVYLDIHNKDMPISLYVIKKMWTKMSKVRHIPLSD